MVLAVFLLLVLFLLVQLVLLVLVMSTTMDLGGVLLAADLILVGIGGWLVRRQASRVAGALVPFWAVAGGALGLGILLIFDRVVLLEQGLLLYVAVWMVILGALLLRRCVHRIRTSGAQISLICVVALHSAAGLLLLFVSVLQLSAVASFDLWSSDAAVRLKPSRRARVNDAGFRGPELSAQRDDLWRLAVLGDSASFGVFVREPRTYPRVLESLLRASFPASQIEVINAGVPGYGARELLVRLHRDVLPHNPDALAILTGANDELDALEEDLGTLLNEVESLGLPVVLVAYPFWNPRDERARQVRSVSMRQARMRGIPLLDTQNLVVDPASFFLFDRAHPSVDGHRAIALALVEEIVRHCREDAQVPTRLSCS